MQFCEILPDELWCEIYSNLDGRTKCRLRRLSRRHRRLIDDYHSWRHCDSLTIESLGRTLNLSLTSNDSTTMYQCTSTEDTVLCRLIQIAAHSVRRLNVVNACLYDAILNHHWSRVRCVHVSSEYSTRGDTPIVHGETLAFLCHSVAQLDAPNWQMLEIFCTGVRTKHDLDALTDFMSTSIGRRLTGLTVEVKQSTIVETADYRTRVLLPSVPLQLQHVDFSMDGIPSSLENVLSSCSDLKSIELIVDDHNLAEIIYENRGKLSKITKCDLSVFSRSTESVCSVEEYLSIHRTFARAMPSVTVLRFASTFGLSSAQIAEIVTIYMNSRKSGELSLEMSSANTDARVECKQLWREEPKIRHSIQRRVGRGDDISYTLTNYHDFVIKLSFIEPE